jgi:hypothetical protein
MAAPMPISSILPGCTAGTDLTDGDGDGAGRRGPDADGPPAPNGPAGSRESRDPAGGGPSVTSTYEHLTDTYEYLRTERCGALIGDKAPQMVGGAVVVSSSAAAVPG